MHKTGAATWQVTNPARRVLALEDPRIKVGTSYADPTTYDLNTLIGEVTFNSDIPADNATVKFHGEYVPVAHVAGANQYDLNSIAPTEDVTEFADVVGKENPGKEFAVSDGAEVKATLSRWSRINNALYLKAMKANKPMLLQMVAVNGDYALGWFTPDSDKFSGKRLLEKEEVSFVLSGDIYHGESAVLRISGAPSDSIWVGAEYSFTPTASGGEASLTYSIENKPAWLSFDTVSGTLSGTLQAGDEGTYSDIVVSVTDGVSSQSLAAFEIVATTKSLNPVAVDDEYSVSSTTTTQIDVLANDNGGTGTATLVSIDSVSLGSAVIAGGKIEYTSPVDAGTATINYTMSDGAGNTSSAILTVTVKAPLSVVEWQLIIHDTEVGVGALAPGGLKIYQGDVDVTLSVPYTVIDDPAQRANSARTLAHVLAGTARWDSLMPDAIGGLQYDETVTFNKLFIDPYQTTASPSSFTLKVKRTTESDWETVLERTGLSGWSAGTYFDIE